ncbi:MAG: YjbQ family protein [Clostridiales bacterium]|nr:YjbQ family protein [Clostridiales bacterium]
MKLLKYDIQSTKLQEFINVSSYIKSAIRETGLISGKVTLFCPHTTAGLTINENADPDVVSDMIRALDKVFPIIGDYDHYEGNSHAHLKSSCVGVDQMVIVQNKNPILGTWQSVYFCEFDGPRKRQLIMTIEGEFDE